MVTMILVGLTLLLLGATLVSYLRHKRFQESRVHMGLLIHMFFVLTAITIGFTFIYYILNLQGPILHVNDPTDDFWDPSFMDLLYFSGVTILSVGYGDFVPIGAARFFALLQAALGLLVPSAFFMTMLGEKIQEKHK